MEYTDFTPEEMIVISKILRIIRREKGISLKMNSDNFLRKLSIAVKASSNQECITLYKQFSDKFSHPELLAEKTVASSKSNNNLTATEPENKQEPETPPGKKKIIYRGQTTYIDDPSQKRKEKQITYRGQTKNI